MAENPWQVESIKAFYYLKCPECQYHTKEENLFETKKLVKQYNKDINRSFMVINDTHQYVYLYRLLNY